MPFCFVRRVICHRGRWIAAARAGRAILSLVGATLFAIAGCSRPDAAEMVRVGDGGLQGGRFAPTDVGAGSWPAWRGGEMGGVAGRGPLPVRFNSTSNVRWVASLDGRGNSSPVAWGNRVFLTTERTVEDGAELGIICLDRVTGRRLWTSQPAVADGPTHSKNGHASATPATDGERLYVSFGSAGLYCFDFEGRLLWRTPLHERQHTWGAASSPALFDRLVIQVCDQPDQGFVAAFDAATGEERWRTPREAVASWSTPAVVHFNGDQSAEPELIVQGSGSSRGRGWVIAYDPANGTELWRARGATDVVCPTPIVAGGLIVSTSGRNGPIFAIRPGGRGDVTRSHVVWKHPRGGPYVPTGVAVGNRLYVLRDEGALDCYDLMTGQRLWRERLRGNFTASLVAGDGNIYATSEQGTVYVIDAGKEFNLLASNRLSERCLATPAIAGNDLLVRTDSRLFCFAATPGTQSMANMTDARPSAPAAQATVASAPSRDLDRPSESKSPMLHAKPAGHVPTN